MNPMTRMQRRKAIERRRIRIFSAVCLAFAIVVLATSFPASALLRQRQSISQSSNDLSTLNAQNPLAQEPGGRVVPAAERGGDRKTRLRDGASGTERLQGDPYLDLLV